MPTPQKCAKTALIKIEGLGAFRYCTRFETKAKDKDRTMRKSGYEDTGLGDPFDIGYPGEFSPGYGALLATGLTTAGILGGKVLMKGPHAKYSYLLGAGLGLGGAGVLYAMGHHRAAMLGAAVTIAETLGELVRAHFIEKGPKPLGYYDSSIAGAGEVELLGDPGDYGQGGGGGIEMLGQGQMPALAASPMDVMGLYQPEMAGAWSPYSGQF